jgi:hypothetical protein
MPGALLEVIDLAADKPRPTDSGRIVVILAINSLYSRRIPSSRKRGFSGNREGRIHLAAIPFA